MSILRGVTRSFFYILACVGAAELPALSSVSGISETRLFVYLEPTGSSGQTVLPQWVKPVGRNKQQLLLMSTYLCAAHPEHSLRDSISPIT